MSTRDDLAADLLADLLTLPDAVLALALRHNTDPVVELALHDLALTLGAGLSTDERKVIRDARQHLGLDPDQDR